MSSLAVPVAIIGSACRFPGDSTSPSKLSALLPQPRDVRREFDPKMLNLQRFYNSNSDAAGSTNVKNKGYLLVEDSRTFDAAFFNISPVEAECMDPQLRILLEIVYEALESAGYTLDEMRGTKTSVHVGVMASDYYDIQIRDPETLPQYAATGTARSTLSNRISYAFDFHGPSITIDTACSSSLVAVHQAVQGLQTGDATCAIVGGANLIFDVMLYIMLSNLHMLSPDSQSRMWDKTVDGYARGEGAAVVLLKPLDQALRDKDCIEGVIRATGVNSDGQSPGLTMPTVKAQAALIRETYRRAGLDPVKDRCQYFECHGTGTAAGDPIEARAISEAMIGDGDYSSHKTTNPLYVGSIKTVVGHLEGGAGLAGLLKALLSIKCRTIFPNLLFKELNPKIEPYYHGLQLPTSALPWQKLPAGDPLRASVNSFGFGGTNAHAILESYEPSDDDSSAETEPFEAPLIGPLVLSANSGSSLLGNVRSLLHYLLENPSVNLSDLSWVLQSKRTTHRVKTFFSAQSHKGLVQSMQKFIINNQTITKDEIGTHYRPVRPGENPSILGVFTGQGAQWPTMGCAMLEKCPLFRRVLEQCDAILNALPDGPEWSVVEELSRGASTSRVGEAAISQPLCTAIQLALISVLYACRIHFDVVIGHSSGEIAAVYACGIISLEAAMQIAYYRGKYAHLAHGLNGQAGAMMVVGVGYAQAQSFCRQPKYQGRVCVAASNAPQSVTLTGDSDAIQHAKKHFDENNTFARMLKVDTAYHSYHMELCADRYLKSLRACNIHVKRPRDGCIWISSVKGDTELLEGNLQSLTGPYWIQNMIQSVLFFQAVKFAGSHGGPFDVAIEIGPHPALKGPTEQTSRFTLGSAPAYVGTLRRDASDVEAVVDAIGFVWSYLGPAFVDFDGLRGAFAHGNCRTPRLLKDLPPYSWDHDRVYWRESRISTRYRKGTDLPQELLGRRLPDDIDRELRWRNILRISELPWLRGHVISGEALLPGTAYISLATEAGKAIAAENPIRLIEVQDINIRRPVVIPETREGLDALFTVHLQESKDPNLICGFFSYYYCSDGCSGSMVHTCDGKLIIRLGEASEEELPPCNPLPPGLLPIDTEQGYSVLAQSGLLYSDTFQRLRDVRRRLNYAVGMAEWSVDELKGSYTVHPALLDVSWQTLLHARADPRAGKLPTALLPVHIGRVAVNPNVELGAEVGTVRLTAESYITSLSGFSITGDVHIYNPCSGKAAVQMEVVSLKSATPPTEAQDRRIFFNTDFIADPSLGLIEPKHDPEAVERVTDLASDIERVVLFYVQRVLEGLNSKDRTELTWYHKLLIQSFETSIQSIQEGLHPLAKQSWLDDKPEILDIIFSKWPNRIDFQLVQAVGENLLGYLRRQTSMLEVVMKDDLAGRLYNDGCGFADISSKYPQANYLEIGAGTGSTTDYVLRTIANAFDTYTYTDISPAFFGEAANRFSEFTGRMIFKTLDVEKDVASQGFSEHCYDVVVASNVLHATSSITRTLGNARSLLKPGGFLLLIEITGTAVMRTTFCVGGLPGWWLGAKEGRRLHPGLSTEGWHRTLQETGFSGVDLVCHDIPDTGQHCLSFMASQAVDDTLLQLREPLEYLADLPQVEHLLVIGGKTLAVSKLATAIQRLVAPVWGKQVTMATDIDTFDLPSIGNQMDVLCLLELDNPLFSSPVTPKRLRALQAILDRGGDIYLCVGHLVGTDIPIVAASETNASIVSIPQGNISRIDEKDCNPVVLQIIGDQILATGFSHSISRGETALLYNPTECLASCLAAESRRYGFHVLYASCCSSAPQSWIKIHPNNSVHASHNLIPQDVTVYFDCSQDLGQHLQVLETQASSYQFTSGIEVLNIGDISNTDPSILDRTHITCWETPKPPRLSVPPPDTSTLFDSGKTYLMIGMASGLGLSIFITSRNPTIHPRWLAEARRQGANVCVQSMDVADNASVEGVVQLIRDSLPPIGGLFVDMDAEAMAKVLKPKVDGSKHLDHIFSDTSLDFFIMLSSALSITGSHGQTNYHAANMFMTGLAAERRRRGLAASVIHIGYVCDVGYFTRADKNIREYVSRMHFKPISEMDVHHAFAEAILSGRPNSQHSCEIGVGIEPLEEPLSKDQQTAWSSDPRFSHYLATAHIHEAKYSSKAGQVNVVGRIQRAETEAEATMAIQDALCTKLETLMQLSPGSVDVNAPLTKLGIDSLVAVEIRAWAIKEIDIDIPVTTLLGKDNIVQICTRMAKHVMAKILEKTSKTINSRTETPEKSPGSVATSSSESPKPEDVSPLTTESETSLIGKEPTVPLNDGKELQKHICEVTGELAMEFGQDIVQKERMTAAQSRIYILSIIINDPTAYSLMIRYDMTGDLDVERLRNALTATMQHHDSLRTCFYVRPEDNQMMQGLLSFPVRRFKHVPEATEEDIANELQMARSKVWDIEHGETLGLAVLSSSPKVHTLVLSYHHIILDATGMRTFIHDLNAAYCIQPLQHDCGSCLELARKEVDSHSSGALECQLQYWQQQHHPVPDVLPLLPMAKARIRPETQQLATIHTVREIGQNATLAVKKACQTLGVTAFQFHLSVVQILLARSLGLEDLCIGVADANRHDDRFASTVGFFLNLLPVRFHIPKDITFAQVAQNTARQVIGALENSAVPFEMILNRLNIPRSSSYAPLFQVTVNYRLAMTKEIPFGDHFLTITDAEEGRTPWDITFSFLESQSDGVTVTMDCSESLYDVEATETLLGMYLRLLEALAKDLNITVRECQVHSPEVVSETLQVGQGRQVEFDWAEAVSEKVQTMCLACPERPAVQDGSSKLTYRQFGARVNSIAAAAKAASLGVGSRIAVLCEPSNDFVASLLAILHIGAVYIPLDVSLPSTRHTAILSGCQPDLVLCHRNTVEPAEALLCEYQSLSLLRIDRIDESYEPVVSHAQPDLPAILLYTSGSTGKPKGVVLSQGNLANWLAQMTQQLELVARPGVICQQSSLGFDASLAQIFCALCTGSSLVIVPQDSRRDSIQIARLIQEYQVTVTLGTPSEYLSWLYYGRESLRKSVEWRWACMVGEPVHHEVKREFRRLELPNLSLLNLYGPTEITFSATCHLLSLSEDEPEMGSTVGKALPNYSICILDATDHPLPFGFQGEICIGGPGVALGYWDLPAETGRRFIPDPTGFNSKGAANRWYRTGDQGRLTSDGTLVYFGRLEGDTQIKLRGIRIELGEVEAALLKSGEGLISRAIVTVHDGVLIAHATLVPGKILEPDSVKQLLSSLGLPQYMCPARLIIVQDLPRTSTGKIDRQALAKLPLTGRDSSSQSVSNLSLHEVELKLLWNKVLPAGDHELGPESDFFLEGGNSLQLTKLQHEIKEVTGISVSTRELYSASTLRQMAARIESQREDQLTENEDINWERETEIPVDLMAAVRGTTRPLSTAVTKDIEVLLTGATGFLGASILNALLGDPAIGKVHCVAIIPNELDKLPESNKIMSYTGSLSLPQLGLTPSECVALQSDVDVIIHAGANGHCLNSYVSLRRPNVYSTHFLAALSLPHSIPFLYVSSPRVPSLAGDLSLPPGPVLSEPSTTGDEGYMASRWVCERFLEKLSHFISFPIEIHRPCLYLGDQAPKTDAMNGVLRYTRLMKSIPRLERVRGYIDFKNVEDIAHDMVAGRKVPFDKWAEYMEELYGGPYKVLELPYWIARAREEGIDPLIATYLEGVLEKKEIGVFPYLGESAE
ncbi:putative polyketide synthase [Aspergillus alliaceus]|uniref:Putative polyketide synthase n=1 Tax=Petromyces alliaceus TaxID=209559 RepID=A0A5N7CGV9_PETAA|nr:putative polyketide synthase [Aspergillus alliaceus]